MRLGLPRLSLDWFDGVGARRVVLYGGYFLLLFAIFLILNFPHEAVVRRALREFNRGPLVAGVERARFAWLNGYELSGVTLSQQSQGADAPPILESASLYVRPALDGLLQGKLSSLAVDADLYGGELQGSLSMAGGMTRARIQLAGVQLGRYAYLRTLVQEGVVSGRLSGIATLEGRGDLQNGRAAGEFDLRDGGVSGAKVMGFGIPDLTFTQISLKFARQGSRLEVQEFRADGDQIKASGEGQVVLREPLEDSVLNLRLTVLPGADAPEDVKTLLSLIPRPKNARLDAPLNITGTLSRPRIR
jgi:type II secretion system protein N